LGKAFLKEQVRHSAQNIEYKSNTRFIVSVERNTLVYLVQTLSVNLQSLRLNLEFFTFIFNLDVILGLN